MSRDHAEVTPGRWSTSSYVESGEDLLFDEENASEKIYALYRGRKNPSIVRYLNYFGKLGGFDEFLRRISSDSPNSCSSCPLEIVQHGLEMISTMS